MRILVTGREAVSARWIKCSCGEAFTARCFTSENAFDAWIAHAKSDSKHWIEDLSDRKPKQPSKAKQALRKATWRTAQGFEPMITRISRRG